MQKKKQKYISTSNNTLFFNIIRFISLKYYTAPLSIKVVSEFLTNFSVVCAIVRVRHVLLVC